MLEPRKNTYSRDAFNLRKVHQNQDTVKCENTEWTGIDPII